MAILLLDRDPLRGAALADELVASGHPAEVTSDLTVAASRSTDHDSSAIVVICDSPAEAGEEIEILRATTGAPIVAMVADLDDSVSLLERGADQCVPHDAPIPLLMANIRAGLRRAAPPLIDLSTSHPKLVFADLTIDLAGHEVVLAGQPLELTPLEFDLLAYLATRPGVIVSKQELMAEVWRDRCPDNGRTIDVHLSWLRRKLGESGASPRFIHTVRGVGVKLVAPATAPDVTPA